MAGATLGNFGAVAMGLVGLISVLRARRRRKDDPAADPAAEKHLAQRLEMERRMASYLAQAGTEAGTRRRNR